jgi:hypothetical protein
MQRLPQALAAEATRVCPALREIALDEYEQRPARDAAQARLLI